MENKFDRFKVVFSQGLASKREVLVDRTTGVNYLFVADGYAGGLTVLLDKDGKPVVTPPDDNTSGK